MFLKSFNLTPYQIEMLKMLTQDGSTAADHVRRALDEYIERMKKNKLNVSTSPSVSLYGQKS